MKYTIQRRKNYATKILSLLIIGFFISNNLALAGDYCVKETLAPMTLDSLGDLQTLSKVKLICDTIENRARYSKKGITIDDVRIWFQEEAIPIELRDEINLTQNDDEIHILVNGTHLIRYYEPGKQVFDPQKYGIKSNGNVIYSDQITPTLSKEVIKVEFLPGGRTAESIFEHVRQKSGELGKKIQIVVAPFYYNPKTQYPISCLDPKTGILMIHPEFIKDFEDIKRSGVGFYHRFSNGKSRWIGLAESIAYRAAMHYFQLDGREGRPHAGLDDNGELVISEDEELANITGRKYGLVNDAIWLWYLRSYRLNITSETGNVRKNNNKLREHIDWIFYSPEHIEGVVQIRKEFPRLAGKENGANFRKALNHVMFINRAFFQEREKLGIDTTPQWRKDESKYETVINPSSESVFAGGPGKTKWKKKTPERLTASPLVKYRTKPDREYLEKHAEKRACVNLQEYLIDMIAQLEVLISDHKAWDREKFAGNLQSKGFLPQKIEEEVKRYLKGMEDIELVLVYNLRNLYKNMKVKVQSEKISTLRARRDQIQEEMISSEKSEDETSLRNLNIDAIRNYQQLVKKGLLVAGRLLTGKSKLKDQMARGAALSALQSVLISATDLEQELNYRIMRLKPKDETVRVIEAVDHEGKVVTTFMLGGFDIKVVKSDRVGEDDHIVIRQQRWININTRLDKIRVDIKKGRITSARKRIRELITLYNIWHFAVLETYVDIKESLKAIRSEITRFEEGRAPPKEEYQPIEKAVKNLIALIEHPECAVWRDIEYKGLDKGFRSQLHTIAGQEQDAGEIRKKISNLEYYISKMEWSSKRGMMSQKNRLLIAQGVEQVYGWSKRGRVDQKRKSCAPLNEVMTLLTEDRALDKGDYSLCIARLTDVIGLLRQRVLKINEKKKHVKKRAATVYLEYRDTDIIARINALLEFFEQTEKGKAKRSAKGWSSEVISVLEMLREDYFNVKLMEPGFIRAENVLRQIEYFVTTARDRGRISPKQREAIAENLGIMKDDIEHKNTLRVLVFNEKGMHRYFHPHPNTSLSGFFNMQGMRKDRDFSKVRVFVNSNQVTPDMFGKVLLDDLSEVRIEPIGKKQLRSTGDDASRDKGPGTDSYEETGAVLCQVLKEYIDENMDLLKEVLGEDKPQRLVRVPVSILEVIGRENAKSFLQALQSAPNIVVEIFSSSKEYTVTKNIYSLYDIEMRPFNQERSRKNTITLFVTSKDEEINAIDIQTRIGGVKSLEEVKSSILVPVGRFDREMDPSGLIRSAIFGFALNSIAQDPDNKVLLKETIEKFKKLCEISLDKDISLTEEDIMQLVFSDKVPRIIQSLRKIIELLPIKRINIDERSRIYEYAATKLAEAA